MRAATVRGTHTPVKAALAAASLAAIIFAWQAIDANAQASRAPTATQTDTFVPARPGAPAAAAPTQAATPVPAPAAPAPRVLPEGLVMMKPGVIGMAPIPDRKAAATPTVAKVATPARAVMAPIADRVAVKRKAKRKSAVHVELVRNGSMPVAVVTKRATIEEPALRAVLERKPVERAAAKRVGRVAAKPAVRVAAKGGESHCLATAIYFEARGESAKGQKAVAEVILARTRVPGRPKTICGVVYEGSHRKTGCQFSFTCDRRSDVARNDASWKQAKTIAAAALRARPKIVRGATFYHATYVSPGWATRMVRVAQIGTHIFYRPKPGHLF